MTYRVFIPDPGCGLISANHRLHHMAKAVKVSAWRKAAREITVGAGPQPTPARVVYHVQKPRGGRYDPANLAPTMKAVLDGMVDAGLLPDDDHKHVIGPDPRRGDKGEPGLWVTVFPYDPSIDGLDFFTQHQQEGEPQ